MIYVTWQPEIAEPGDYFLTRIDSNGLDLTIDQIMDIAHEIEELDIAPYDICSILRVSNDVEVIY